MEQLVLWDGMDMPSGSLEERAKYLADELRKMPLSDCIDNLNMVREILHSVSPFASEPVDCVIWVPSSTVKANDYNPNSVAPPEMELLRVSISEDGYTQPIVSMPDGELNEVIDGFHRHRVGKECKDIQARIHGYLPIVRIRKSQQDVTNRMASTIRHNRARGKHKVEAMSDIVVELKRRNWSDEKISKNLGMDQDEILRLCQITGLSELFSNQEFSASWDVEGQVTESDFVALTDDVSTYGNEAKEFRTVNTSDETRIFHTYDKWECYKAGFYDNFKDGLKKEQCEEIYRAFLANLDEFEDALSHVTTEWVNSCEHYLTNAAMNRIAWLGQTSVCYAKGIPSAFRSGFSLLTKDQQIAANELALRYLNKWLVANGRPEVTMSEAYSGDRQSDIY